MFDLLKRKLTGANRPTAFNLKQRNPKPAWQRLLEAVGKFPGRTERELALIVHGKPVQQLVNQDSRMLEFQGKIRREKTDGVFRLFLTN